MKNNRRFLLITVILLVLLIGAYFGYSILSGKYNPEKIEAVGETEINTAADFTVFDLEGNEVKLSDFFGKPVVVNFWASWCGPCRMELPAFDNLAEEYGEDVEFMMVNLTDGYRETVSGIEKFVTSNGLTFPLYFDINGNASTAYSVYSIPLTVFIDSDGNVKNKHNGTMSENKLRTYIESLTE
ncbi:MAG: TlpA family protein disulfide reductase [Clostridiales bacterium]|nr:TlpA family protein disulfide reductase [Clostridiales bacterium]